jgi:glucosamine 6-phosphate synthetase-like amidotransferase/phosphosugar isomerase protein
MRVLEVLQRWRGLTSFLEKRGNWGNCANWGNWRNTNIPEVTARSGRVIAIAIEGDTDIAGLVEHVIYIPAAHELLLPILEVVPLQLLAYHIAVRGGCDVDEPRNLAKGVTVE